MNWNRGRIPLLSKEGWLRASKKWPRSLTGAAGVVLIHTQPPRPLLGVAATPPWKGGECPRFQFIHTFPNSQFPSEKTFRPPQSSHRMRIGNWELNIGQIPLLQDNRPRALRFFNIRLVWTDSNTRGPVPRLDFHQRRFRFPACG